MSEQQNRTLTISRRRFLMGAASSLPLLLAAACVQPTAAPAPAASATEAPAAAPASSGGAAAGEGKPGGVLRIAGVADPRTFTPVRQLEWWQWGGLYDSLLRYKPNLEVYGHLAESFTISEDGKTVDLVLKKGAKFASGREFNADDVEWMITLMKDAQAGALFRTFALAITEIKKPDPYHVTLIMEKPDAGLIDLLANMYIPDREKMENIDKEGFGTGPFDFVEFLPGDHITFKRKEDYWGPKAYLERIEFKVIGDAQAVVANLEAGAIDFAGVPLQEYVRLKDDARFNKIKMVGGSGVLNIWLNTKRPPFDNKLVRQAMNYAIDRERFVRTTLMGESKPLWQPFTDNHWAHFADLENAYPFDLDKAKALLAEAGLADGFETTINADSSSAFSMGLAQIYQADLDKIGVKAKIDAKDSPSWAEASDRSQFDINMHGYGRNNADPTLLMKGTVAWRPEKNPTGWDDPKYAELISAQSTVLDREKRKPLVKDLIKYIQDECFVMPVAGNISTWLYDARIQGLEMLTVGVVGYAEKIWWNK
jgi:peptide/nickel transport system substrate-binding protein